jgi:hypothetical protein
MDRFASLSGRVQESRATRRSPSVAVDRAALASRFSARSGTRAHTTASRGPRDSPRARREYIQSREPFLRFAEAARVKRGSGESSNLPRARGKTRDNRSRRRSEALRQGRAITREAPWLPVRFEPKGHGNANGERQGCDRDAAPFGATPCTGNPMTQADEATVLIPLRAPAKGPSREVVHTTIEAGDCADACGARDAEASTREMDRRPRSANAAQPQSPRPPSAGGGRRPDAENWFHARRRRPRLRRDAAGVAATYQVWHAGGAGGAGCAYHWLSPS